MAFTLPAKVGHSTPFEGEQKSFIPIHISILGPKVPYLYCAHNSIDWDFQPKTFQGLFSGHGPIILPIRSNYQCEKIALCTKKVQYECIW